MQAVCLLPVAGPRREESWAGAQGVNACHLSACFAWGVLSVVHTHMEIANYLIWTVSDPWSGNMRTLSS